MIQIQIGRFVQKPALDFQRARSETCQGCTNFASTLVRNGIPIPSARNMTMGQKPGTPGEPQNCW